MTLAPIASIQFKQEALPATDFGRRPELKWVPLAQLRVDKAYQRDVLDNGRATIRRMVEGFRWSKFGQLVVAPRGNDAYALIDGQHRAIACMCLGIDRAPCIVVTCDPEEEAEAFAAINSNITRPSALQIHAARLMAGDRTARALKRVCDAAGVTVPRYPVVCDQVGMTTAIVTLQSCLRKFGPEILTAALTLIVGTGGGNAGLLRTGIIAGFCDVLQARCVTQRHMIAALASAPIDKLYAKAKRIQAVDGGTLRQHFAAAVAKALDQTSETA